MSVGKLVRSSQRGGDVHPPGTDNGPVAPKSQEKLHCPDEKQQGSCTAQAKISEEAALPWMKNSETLY